MIITKGVGVGADRRDRSPKTSHWTDEPVSGNHIKSCILITKSGGVGGILITICKTFKMGDV